MLAERARVVKELPESERAGGGGAGLLAAEEEAGDMAACSGGSAESEASGGDAGLCRRCVEALELVEAEEADWRRAGMRWGLTGEAKCGER
jgi:hypothetical protein